MKTIKIYEGKIIHEIKLGDITHFMADGKCTHVFFLDKTHICSTKMLKHYHEQLHEKEGFFRTHRKYLVNMIHVVGIIDERKPKSSKNKTNTKDISLSEKHRLSSSRATISFRGRMDLSSQFTT